MKKFTFVISCGDINGISAEILINSHSEIEKICRPVYSIHPNLLSAAGDKLRTSLPNNLEYCPPDSPIPVIEPGKNSVGSGRYSFKSFQTALEWVDNARADAILTLPVSKKAWQLAQLHYKGHTDYLSEKYSMQSIMMMGCCNFWVALFTDHVPLKQVPDMIKSDRVERFLKSLSNNTGGQKIMVVGLNPHAGEGGIFGDEDTEIKKAIDSVNCRLDNPVFYGPVSADSAFTEKNRKTVTHYVAMYHDQGLIPVKTLYFDRAVNISLNLPVKRASVGHGTGFDIAYGNTGLVSAASYIEAVKTLVGWCQKGAV